MLIVVVDDEREFSSDYGATVSRLNAEHYKTSSAGFWRMIEAIRDEEKILELWLDHDLGGNDDIRDFVRMMAEDAAMGQPWPVMDVLVHTSNVVGREWIEGTLEKFYSTSVVPAPTKYGLVKA